MDMLQYYYTAKVVGIKSKRLGYLYYSVVSLIIVYTLYAMLINKQYFAFEGQLFGAVNMRLGYDQPQISTNGLSYCSGSAKGQCEILDKFESSTSQLGSKSIFIKTKISEIVEERECTRQSDTCQTNNIWKRVSKHTYYVANIDSSIVSLKHSFRAPTFYEESGHSKIYSQDQQEMRGVLFSSGDCKNEIPVEFNPKNQSYRKRGFTVLLDLSYNNIRCDGSPSCMFGVVPTTFRIRPNIVPGEVLQSETISDFHENNTRVRKVSHGILIHVEQSGKIGKFSIFVLLMTLVSGLGMITIATVVCDNIATYLDGRKDAFVEMKYSFESYQKDNSDNKTEKVKQS